MVAMRFERGGTPGRSDLLPELQTERTKLSPDVMPCNKHDKHTPATTPNANSSPFGSTRIPVEILSFIFALSCVQRATFYPKRAPWSLSQVCRVWRNAALSTPSLWTSIWIDTGELGPQNADVCVSNLSNVLERTQDQPLNVQIIIRFPPFGPCSHPASRWQPLFDVLRSQSHRWRSLVLDFSGNRGISPVFPDLHPLSSAFDILETVELRHICRSSYIPLLQSLECAPNLQRITLAPFDTLCEGTSPLPFPWHQLHHLDLSGLYGALPLPQVFSALAQCTQLHTLIARQTRLLLPPTINFHAAHEISIPSLRTLQLHINPNPDFPSEHARDWLSSRLTLPNLHHLYVVGVRWDTDVDLTSIFEMLDRSDCHITHLTLADITIMDVTIVRLLRHPRISQIKRLTLRGHLYRDMFDSLTIPGMLPGLEVLDVGMVYEDDRVVLSCPAQSIVGLIRAREDTLKATNLKLCRGGLTQEHRTVTALEELNSSLGINWLDCPDYNLTVDTLAIKQLGGLLKPILPYLLGGGGAGSGYLPENVPVVQEIFDDLEARLSSIDLCPFDVVSTSISSSVRSPTSTESPFENSSDPKRG
ncbi:hypothetical protein AAF712_006257 [Marasmius tenuissimus]|uniref:F-box domain-containing protein n=1 Tax=Marasmius tenuissimus TaxID=585030 RepID=A0ABR3A0V0_9AGAR